METFNDEKLVLKHYRWLFPWQIKYFGNLFRCFRIETLTKSFLFSRSWVDSSSKSDPPPDFYNERHKIMMDIMRIDDCVNKIKGKKVNNSFARENIAMVKMAGEDYKERLNGTLYFVADTRDNKEFNINGYYKNFARVLNEHSDKIENYRKNHPKCKTCVLFVFDESNDYVQLTDNTKFLNGSPYGEIRVHQYFADKKMIDVIRNTKADYVIWMTRHKSLYINNKRVRMPRACIYDVKHFKQKGVEYDYQKMYKVTEQVKQL